MLEVLPREENRSEGPSALVGSWAPRTTLPRVAANTFRLPLEALGAVQEPLRGASPAQLSCPRDALPMACPQIFAKPPLSLHL